jgi:hypothetical protein
MDAIIMVSVSSCWPASRRSLARVRSESATAGFPEPNRCVRNPATLSHMAFRKMGAFVRRLFQRQRKEDFFADRIHFDASNSFFISAAFSIWPVAS